MAKQYKAIGTVVYGKAQSAAHGEILKDISASEAAELVSLGAAEEVVEKAAEEVAAPAQKKGGNKKNADSDDEADSEL